MKSNRVTRPVLLHPHSKSKSKSTSKSKSKSKKKQKKFNPIEYLNTLIDMQNTVEFSNKKKTKPKRNISSALTVATPHIENTLSSAKIRSKSSQGYYRKKHHISIKEAMTINLDNIITQQQPIKFTQNSARNSIKEPLNYAESKNETRCAIIIQRAWRNYQTYKMVHQHYIFEKNKQKKISLDNPKKTLKISEQKHERRKNTYKESVEKESPIKAVEEEINQLREDQKFDEMKQKQAERWDEALQIMEQSNKNSNEEILRKLLIKFEQNKKKLQEEMQKQLQQYQMIDSIPSKEEKSEDEKKSEQSMLNIQDFSNDNLNSEDQYDVQPELKIFTHQLNLLEESKRKKLQIFPKIQEEMPMQQNFSNRIQILNQNHIQKKELEASRNQFIFGMNSLKKTALNYLKNVSLLQKQKYYPTKLQNVRRSFSAGSIVIKSVIQSIQNIEFQSIQHDDFLNEIFFKHSTPPKNTPQASVIESYVEKQNTEMMKKYTQNIQSQIQKDLINEFLSETFRNDTLYRYFRPFIQSVYQFKTIKDSDILQFVEIILPKYYPSEREVLHRINQKINPTSLQILRIIRDPDFEIQQYQLIIPEQSFKRYRADIEKSYLQLNGDYQLTIEENFDEGLLQKITEREKSKNEKVKKYRNFERDLKIMYMKAVFNCFNEFLIEAKSMHSFMNSRSSFGPGELTLAIKEYNQPYHEFQKANLFSQVKIKMANILTRKCKIPQFKTYRELQDFQVKIMQQIKVQYMEGEFKWVNYMDEVLQIWQDLCELIVDDMILDASLDIEQLL